jgi:hypothetical protein
MNKYLVILLMLIIGIAGYKLYSYKKEQEAQERALKNKPKVVDFKKDFNKIFFGTEKEPDVKKNEGETKEIKTLNPSRKHKPGVRTLTNKDIDRLNIKSSKSRKMITKDDIRKLKEKDPDNFDNNVEIEKTEKKKPEKKLSPLEKIIDSAKKSFSEKDDSDSES